MGDECDLEGFFDLGPGLVCICDMFIFQVGEPSLGKSFSLSLELPIEKNHYSCFIRVLIHIKSEVGPHGHKIHVPRKVCDMLYWRLNFSRFP